MSHGLFQLRKLFQEPFKLGNFITLYLFVVVEILVHRELFYEEKFITYIYTLLLSFYTLPFLDCNPLFHRRNNAV